MLAEALRSPRSRPLARLVHEKTAGNPFFAIQFLTALAEEGLLAFDRDAASWKWDLERIRAKDYTDNVVDFLLGKLRLLPGTTCSVLQQLACFGNSADVTTLALVQDATGGCCARKLGRRCGHEYCGKRVAIGFCTIACGKLPMD